jgi:acid phosphatase (class A)
MLGSRLVRRGAWFSAFVSVLLVAGFAVHRYHGEPRYLHAPPQEFVALFVAPPAAHSLQTRQELDQLLAIQERRTQAEVDAARADRKTEVWQFAGSLGLTPQQVKDLKALGDLAEQVEDDVRPYVRAAKHRFLRLRPYEVEPRIEPCIEDVRGDLSYPSGHATYGYVMAYLLSDMIPGRRPQLIARAQEFARQRAVCGVHFPSDLEAGRIGAAWLTQRFLASQEYQASSAGARREVRAAVVH